MDNELDYYVVLFAAIIAALLCWAATTLHPADASYAYESYTEFSEPVSDKMLLEEAQIEEIEAYNGTAIYFDWMTYVILGGASDSLSDYMP